MRLPSEYYMLGALEQVQLAPELGQALHPHRAILRQEHQGGRHRQLVSDQLT